MMAAVSFGLCVDPVCACVCVYLCMYMCVYICMHVCIHATFRVYMLVYMFCACVRACACVWLAVDFHVVGLEVHHRLPTCFHLVVLLCQSVFSMADAL